MADYFEEMGWMPLGPGEIPNQLPHTTRLYSDFRMWEQLQYGQRLPPPASKDSIDNLEEKEVTTSGDQCPICLKVHIVGEIVKGLPCKHAFHSTCILSWLGKTNSCPVCRHELPTDSRVYEAFRKEKQRANQREADLDTLHNSMFS